MTSTVANDTEPVADGFAVFRSPVGACAVAWRGRAVVATQLPEGSATSTRARMRARVAAPEVALADAPPSVVAAVGRIAAVLDGADDDLRSVEVDLDAVSPFERSVYRAARDVAPGATTTYGDIARETGGVGLARAVGRALGNNPVPLVVPCHRVVGASGTLGGFSAVTGPVLKLRLLALEGRGADLAMPYDVGSAAAYLRTADPVLARVVDQVGPPSLRREPHASAFAALAEAVVHEQPAASSGATAFARLCASLPRPLDGPTPDALLGLADEHYVRAGVSRAATRSLRELAAHALFGGVPDDDELAASSDDEVVALLTDVPGVGRTAVERVLATWLGRPDVLQDDGEIRRAVELAYERRLSGQDELTAVADAWRPYRSVASWYLRRLLEDRGLRTEA